MEALNSIVGAINGVVWGPLMLVLILGVGFFLQVGLKFMPILRIGTGFSLLFKGREGQGEGQISPFNALMTSLSATIGTGNIAGVATAVFLGGPGALFWMWMTALVGMATKYAEAVCAVKYREKDEAGQLCRRPDVLHQERSGREMGLAGCCIRPVRCDCGLRHRQRRAGQRCGTSSGIELRPEHFGHRRGSDGFDRSRHPGWYHPHRCGCR